MTYRELSAWVMSAALIAGAAFYFNTVRAASAALGELAPPFVGPVFVYVMILVILSVIGLTIAAMIAPKTANEPTDERERTIVSRAGSLSGALFGFSVVGGLGGYLFTGDGDLLFYIVFGSLMASQLAEYLLQIWYYRRGV